MRERYPGFRLESEKLEMVIDDDIEILLVNGRAGFIRESGELIPHLRLLLRHGYRDWLPYIVVDQGAVGPISRGADLMRPGIIEIEGGFEAGSIVVIAEPTRLLPLAVHRALYSSREIEAMSKGRVTKRVHYVGDRYWRYADEHGF